eukprot:SAG25_NODE_8410_length_423_cov_1.879630_1_plen_78_part_10
MNEKAKQGRRSRLGHGFSRRQPSHVSIAAQPRGPRARCCMLGGGCRQRAGLWGNACGIRDGQHADANDEADRDGSAVK